MPTLFLEHVCAFRPANQFRSPRQGCWMHQQVIELTPTPPHCVRSQCVQNVGHLHEMLRQVLVLGRNIHSHLHNVPAHVYRGCPHAGKRDNATSNSVGERLNMYRRNFFGSPLGPSHARGTRKSNCTASWFEPLHSQTTPSCKLPDTSECHACGCKTTPTGHLAAMHCETRENVTCTCASNYCQDCVGTRTGHVCEHQSCVDHSQSSIKYTMEKTKCLSEEF